MRIYTKIVIDMKTGKVSSSDCFEYVGKIAFCKSGGTTVTNTQDPEYNARMATIAEEELGMAKDYYQYWEEIHKPMEIEQVAANRELIPYQTSLAKKQLQEESNLISERAPIRSAFFEETLSGVDPEEYMSQAQADVEHGYNVADQSMRSKAFRAGVDPGSGRFLGLERTAMINKAKDIAGARTSAYREAEDTQYERLAMASGL